MYQPTRDEYAALHYLAIALRPEFKNGLGPGKTWDKELKDRTFEHAENFNHCITALIDYCQASNKDGPAYTHATLYPGEGDHWRTTVPVSIEKNPREPCQDHPHDKNNRHSCIGCRSEILSGDRPWNMQGKPLVPEQRQIIPSPGILTGHAHDAAQ